MNLNEQIIKKFISLVSDIYKSLNSPLPQEDDLNSGIKNYTDKNGKVHLSKMLRNSLASQRLYSFLDRIKETIFTHQYFSKEFELKNSKVDRKYLEIYFSRNLVFLNIQLVNGLINFLSYFFDLPMIDDKIDMLEFRNFLNIRDKQICLEIEKILKSIKLQRLKIIFKETKNDYAGLSKITDRTVGNIKSSIKIDTLKGYPLKEILSSSSGLINKHYTFLQFVKKHIQDNYKDSFGYDSSNDFAAKIDPKTGYFKGSTLEKIQKAKQNTPIKIMNFITDSPQQIDNKYFTVHKNHTFREIKGSFYRSSQQESTTIKLGRDSPVAVEKKAHQPQEGNYFWTHTLIFKKDGLSKKARLLINTDFAEDICLLLSLFSGVGVYTKQTALRYSHKARLPWKLNSFEFQDAVGKTIEKIGGLDTKEANILGLALSKYREAMQPMSANNGLVRLWEILDILGNFYCENHKKKIPDGYSEKSLRKKIKCELNKLEQKITIPLMPDGDKGKAGFTPILIEKSIGQKIRELIETQDLHNLLEIELKQLNKRVSEANSLRSKLTHSAVNFTKNKNKKDLTNYYLFVSQLVFLILLVLCGVEPKQTLLELRKDIKGFVEDKEYYKRKSDALRQKNKEFDEFVKYLSGEKPWPAGKTTFIF